MRWFLNVSLIKIQFFLKNYTRTKPIQTNRYVHESHQKIAETFIMQLNLIGLIKIGSMKFFEMLLNGTSW